jgi:hypothetical protein
MVCGHLVYFYILVCLDQEKSGNPDAVPRPFRHKLTVFSNTGNDAAMTLMNFLQRLLQQRRQGLFELLFF